MKPFYSTTEAAEFLEVTPNTIYQYIKNKILNPCNLEEFEYSRQYLFTHEELERVKKEFFKPGLTTTEVSKILNVKPHTVFTYIKEGKLPAEKKEYKGRLIYFIQEKDLSNFQSTLQQRQKNSRRSFYLKSHNICLFQLFIHTDTNQKARIIELSKKDIVLQFEDGRFETISLHNFSESCFSPAYTISSELIHRKGEVTFKFPKPRTIEAISYFFIDYLFQHVGYSNMMISEKNEMITVKVKPVSLHISQEESDLLDLMKQSLVNGELIEGPKFVRLISPTTSLHIKEIPRTLKEKIKEKSKKEHTSMEQVVVSILKNYFGEER